MRASILAVLSLVFAVAFAQSCQLLNQKDAKGSFYYDLTPLKSSSNYAVDAPGDYGYKLNFCAGVNSPCNENGKEKGSNFKAIQQHKFQELCFYLAGDASTSDVQMAMIDSSNADAGVKITYTKGEPSSDGKIRESEISVKCDAKATSAPSIDFVNEGGDASVIEYFFTTSSDKGCPIRGDSPSGGNDRPLGGLGVMGLLMILGFVAFILYFIIGIIVCKFALKKTGIEIIPNVHFWKDLPFLLKDGVMLPVDIIMSLTKRGQYKELADPK